MESSLDSKGKRVKILDCTFRDGGYYNNWDFPDKLFADYLSVLGSTQIEFLEVGFRFARGTGFRGAHAYTPDEYLKTFELPKEKSFGVMINAADMRKFDSAKALIDNLFGPIDESPIRFVRIASHEAEIQESQVLAKILMDMGYQVAINLMQISEVPPRNLFAIANGLASLPLLSFYVADSLGSLTPEKVEEIFGGLVDSTDLPLGLHAHDNLGLAHQNSMVAIDKGATFIDGTLRGMGRGPGNTKTEELALSLHVSDIDFRGAVELGRFSDNAWAALQKDLGWGRNLAYFAAGLLRVHPTYVQELLADSRQDETSTLLAVRQLSRMGATRFDQEKLADTRSTPDLISGDTLTLPNFDDWRPIQCDEAIVLGPGPSLQTYSRALSVLLEKKPEALVLSVNGADIGVVSPNSFRVISHRRQVDSNADFFMDASSQIILPSRKLADLLPPGTAARCFNVHFTDSERLEAGDGQVSSPVNNVFSYACGLAHLAGAKKLFIAGFDGIGGGDSRDFEMAQILNELRVDLGVEVWSLTPTNLPIETLSPLSLFEPNSIK